MTSATGKFNVEIPDGCEQYRETHLEYSEKLGEAYKSISIETYLTNSELVELCRELLGDDAK